MQFIVIKLMCNIEMDLLCFCVSMFTPFEESRMGNLHDKEVNLDPDSGPQGRSKIRPCPPIIFFAVFAQKLLFNRVLNNARNSSGF